MKPASVRRAAGRALAASGSGQAIAMAATFASTLMLARMLAPSDLGLYYLYSVVALFAPMIARLGQDRVIVRELAAHEHLRNVTAIRVLASSLTVNAVAAIILATLVALTLPIVARELFGAGEAAATGVLVGLWVLFESLRLVPSEAQRGMRRHGLATIVGSPGRTVIFAVLVGAVWIATLGSPTQTSLKLVLALSLGASAVTFLVGLLFLLVEMRRAPVQSGFPHREDMLRQAKAGALIATVGAVALGITQADTWVVGAFFGTEDAAAYGAAVRVASLALAPILVSQLLLQPYVVRFRLRHEDARLESLLRCAATVGFVLLATSTALIAALGGWLLPLFFGEFFSQSHWPAVILMSGLTIAAGLGPAFQTVVMAGGSDRAVLGVMSAVATITIISELTVAGVSVLAVATASGVGSVLQGFGGWWLARTRLDLDTRLYLSPRQFVRAARATGIVSGAA
ncbi:lipopolysaccharide biosynthesis protein [Rhabdothermincola salaria]|uniref:lipopolysaccharide biosynthesis protein n=1 Tax=Rhabdothermincola salaria TaxID=2903142 RepID=UPI001E4CF2DA|nr:oligosaccharide flippase family protein [Rhabdothermincola salaria]